MGFGNSNWLVRDFSKSQIGVQKFKLEKLNDGGELGEKLGYNFTF